VIQVGSRVGPYEIVAKLRDGGMASLFLGRRLGVAGFTRHVAIKVIHPQHTGDRDFVKMFIAEALLSSRISHPNVVHVEELGEADGTYYLAMEYVHGCAMSQLLQTLGRSRRRLDPTLAVGIAMAIADGLHAAHEAKSEAGEPLGIVHRDVSPQNVLLSYSGHVKLIDFGIAKATGASDSTRGGSIKGKIRYMSPEQAYGRPVNRTTDVYALGIVLWEALTGRRAFNADNDFAMLEVVRHPAIDPPRTHTPGLPRELDGAVMHALALDPAQRPPTAADFRQRLSDAVPRAAGLVPGRLAELMQIAMASQIVKQREALPDSVSQVAETKSATPVSDANSVSGDAEEVLRTLTSSAVDVQIDFEETPLPDDGSEPLVPLAAPPMTTGTDMARRRASGRGRAWTLVGVATLVAVGGVTLSLRPWEPRPTPAPVPAVGAPATRDVSEPASPSAPAIALAVPAVGSLPALPDAGSAAPTAPAALPDGTAATARIAHVEHPGRTSRVRHGGQGAAVTGPATGGAQAAAHAHAAGETASAGAPTTPHPPATSTTTPATTTTTRTTTTTTTPHGGPPIVRDVNF